jgi:hypothetical protein
MQSEKTSTIKSLLDCGRGQDLLDIIHGISKYSVSQNLNDEPDLETVKLVSAAKRHIQFISKFGSKNKYVEIDGQFMFPSPEKFDKWLLAGAPGIEKEELDAYLVENPLT